MAVLVYKNQARLERLAAKVTGIPGVQRMSDLEQTLFSQGNTITRRKSDELAYYQGKNGDGATIDRKFSDAAKTYWDANGAKSSGRTDQSEHEFYNQGSFT